MTSMLHLPLAAALPGHVYNGEHLPPLSSKTYSGYLMPGREVHQAARGLTIGGSRL